MTAAGADLSASLRGAPTGLAEPLALGGPAFASALVFGSLALLASLLVFGGLALLSSRPALGGTGRRPGALAGLALAGGAAIVGIAAAGPALDRIPRGRADLPAFAGLALAVAWMALPVGLAAAGHVRRGGSASALLQRAALGGPLLGILAAATAWVAAFQTASVPAAGAVVGCALGLAAALFAALRRWHAGSALPGVAVSTVALATAAAASVGFIGRGFGELPAEHAPAPSDTRSVVLISVDTLRADALSVYGGRVPTPAFERLAGDGLVFESARAPSPWTKPSSVSLLTGLAPWVHGAVGRFDTIPAQIETLAERLHTGGFAAGAVVSNHYLGRAYDFHQGFDAYEAFPRGSFGGSWGAKFARRLFGRAWSEEASTRELTDRALAWLDAASSRPFFLWLHYFDPHVPYEPPSDLLPRREAPHGMGPVFDDQWAIRTGHVSPDVEQRTWIRDLYDAEVRYVDRELGRLLAALDARGLYEESLIVLTSDHGEEFWEHGSFEHGHSVFDEVLRVPLIVKLPGSSRRGRTSEPVAITSVAPTIVDWLGLPFDAADFSAPSLRPVLENRAATTTDARLPWVASDLIYHENRTALLVDRFKYVLHEVSGRESIYDLARDPGEVRDLIAERGDVAARGRERLAALRARARAERRAAGLEDRREATPDEETLRRLRELGYIQ